MGKIADFLKKLNLTDEQLKDHLSEVDQLDKELEKKPEPTPEPKPEPKSETKVEKEPTKVDVPDDQKSLIETFRSVIKEEIEPIAQKVDTLEKDVQSKASNEKAQRIEKLLEDAVASGRIEPAKKDEWKKDLEENYDIAERAINRLPENPNLKKAGEKREDKGQTGSGTAPKPTTNFARSADQTILKHITEELAANE